MNRSIRRKLFLVFISLITCTLLGGIIINILFLEDYYVYKNKDSFIEITDTIDAEYKINKKNIQSLISTIFKEDGISTYIIDESFNIVLYSASQKVIEDSSKVNKDIQTLITTKSVVLNKGYIYEKLDKDNGQSPKIVLIKRLSNNEMLVLTKPLKGISESAKIANQFFLFTGLIITAIGTVVIYIFSSKLTNPIVKMSVVAENIANLNFDKKVNVQSKDEIGSLGESINNISKKLSITMTRLTNDIELRKELVRNMSHELKTPIGVIKGYAEGINYGVASNEEMLNKYCNVISEECDRMDSLVKELLELSKLEEISYELNLSQFTVDALMTNIKNRFIPLMEKNQINYGITYEKNISINADFYLLERAITNFITNAIKYVDDNKTIKINISKVNDKLEFSVFNTGKQISEDELTKIWNVFYKVDKSRSRQEVGHGLGLAIVKLIVELHDGVVATENLENGVKFSFKI